jgi:hypothetical protein
MTRKIGNILNFRIDISPFLVHLTKTDDVSDAKAKLMSILDVRRLVRGCNAISAMRFAEGCNFSDQEIVKQYLSAICFTETPLSEIHTMLDIEGRRIDLQPYGLVFIKDRLKQKGVSPVLYLNTYYQDEEVNKLIDLLWKVRELNDEYKEYTKRLFPLISSFGLKLRREPNDESIVDFYWEREWRYCLSQVLTITKDDIFMGLCHENDIDDLEAKYSALEIKFMDPRKHVKWYADKLVRIRKEKDIQQSVV